MDEITLVIVCVFGTVAMLLFMVIRALMGGAPDSKLRSRLVANAQPDAPQQQSSVQGQSKGGGTMFQRMGQAAAAPFMPNTREKQSALRRNLGYAGIYSPTAI